MNISLFDQITFDLNKFHLEKLIKTFSEFLKEIFLKDFFDFFLKEMIKKLLKKKKLTDLKFWKLFENFRNCDFSGKKILKKKILVSSLWVFLKRFL